MGNSSIKMHGVMMVVDDFGVMITGPSGSGKTYTALDLIRSGHKFIADDVVAIELEKGQHSEAKLFARCPEANPRIELRGLGIFDVELVMPGCVVRRWPLHVIFALRSLEPSDFGRLEPQIHSASILDVSVPCVDFPTTPESPTAMMIRALLNYMKGTGLLKP